MIYYFVKAIDVHLHVCIYINQVAVENADNNKKIKLYLPLFLFLEIYITLKVNIIIPSISNISCCFVISPSFHFASQMLDRTFSLNVDDVFNMIFFDSPFFQSLLAKRNTYNITVGEWTDIDPNNVSDDLKEYKQYRNLSYTMDVNQSMAKTVSTTEVQYLYASSTPGQAYVIKSEVSNMGFPLSSSFRVDTVYYLSRGETENECNLQIYGKVVFKKSAWGMKSLIEDSTIQGLSTYVEDLTRSLLELTEPDLKNIKLSNGSSFLSKESIAPMTESIIVTRDPIIAGKKSLSLRKRSSSTSSSSLSPNIIDQKLSSESGIKKRRDHLFINKIQTSLGEESSTNQIDTLLIRTVFVLLILLSTLNFFLYIRLLRLEDSAQLLKSILHPDFTVQS
uniref:VASt domain-containing protein n=1 Tax=Tetranychus urticae TaxID=32264 RepID=T1JVT2_TETUR